MVGRIKHREKSQELQEVLNSRGEIGVPNNYPMLKVSLKKNSIVTQHLSNIAELFSINQEFGLTCVPFT